MITGSTGLSASTGLDLARLLSKLVMFLTGTHRHAVCSGYGTLEPRTEKGLVRDVRQVAARLDAETTGRRRWTQNLVRLTPVRGVKLRGLRDSFSYESSNVLSRLEGEDTGAVGSPPPRKRISLYSYLLLSLEFPPPDREHTGIMSINRIFTNTQTPCFPVMSLVAAKLDMATHDETP